MFFSRHLISHGRTAESVHMAVRMIVIWGDLRPACKELPIGRILPDITKVLVLGIAGQSIRSIEVLAERVPLSGIRQVQLAYPVKAGNSPIRDLFQQRKGIGSAAVLVQINQSAYC